MPNSNHADNGQEVYHLVHTRGVLSIQIIDQQSAPFETFLGLRYADGMMCTSPPERSGKRQQRSRGCNEFIFGLRELISLEGRYTIDTEIIPNFRAHALQAIIWIPGSCSEHDLSPVRHCSLHYAHISLEILAVIFKVSQ